MFYDQQSLRFGDDIPLVIERALGSALRVLFVLSDASLRSQWARFESTLDWGQREAHFTAWSPQDRSWAWLAVQVRLRFWHQGTGLLHAFNKLRVLRPGFDLLVLDLRSCPAIDSDGIGDFAKLLEIGMIDRIEVVAVLERESRVHRLLQVTALLSLVETCFSAAEITSRLA